MLLLAMSFHAIAEPAALATMVVDGRLDEPEWSRAPRESRFTFPWSNREAPKTEFRAFADSQTFYFGFIAEDAEVVVEKRFVGESTLDREDRVELFFAADEGLHDYYCVEIDPLGRVHDYAAHYHRQFDSAWNCPGLRVAGRRTRTGYVVEGTIPLKTISQMVGREVHAGSEIRIGLFRAEFQHGDLGTRDDNWLSWIVPSVKTPDFHVPSAFTQWRIPGNQDRLQTRGVVLVPDDLSLQDWPERAANAGLNTIGLHHGISPSAVGGFINSEAGRQFLEWCRRRGLQVEYELHAMGELLPRGLFSTDPDLFRMNEKGERTPDANLCVHSQRALELVGQNAIHLARQLRPTTGRYFFWGDDGQPWCRCPRCRGYSDSDQALLLENYLIHELRKHDPTAQLAHLAYANTLAAPTRVRPAPGIFLEYAPISRDESIPYERQNGPQARDSLAMLVDNLKIFPKETAQVLEYCLDVSRASGWKRPAVRLPWHPEVLKADVAFYERLGIRHLTTFAVWIDKDYVRRFGESKEIGDYGTALYGK
jgi:hypothetical protein